MKPMLTGQDRYRTKAIERKDLCTTVVIGWIDRIKNVIRMYGLKE